MLGHHNNRLANAITVTTIVNHQLACFAFDYALRLK
jgi:hypothetical protein